MQNHGIGVVLRDMVTSFTGDFDVSDHGILHQVTAQECHFVYVPGVALDALCGLGDVREVVDKALLIAGYRGRASKSTVTRNLPGNVLGVSTSTSTLDI